MNTISRELPRQTEKIDILPTKYRENYYGGPLAVSGQIIGAPFWQKMIAETQADNKERGIVISRKSNKDIITSSVFIGEEKSFTPLVLPHGLKSLFSPIKDIALVHTHAMPLSSDHLLTTTFSDGDIRTFIPSKYYALIAIDRGGAHLLVRKHKPYMENIPEANMISKIIAETIEENGSTMDVIKKISSHIKQFDLAYLFTPQLTPDLDGNITFQDPTNKL